MRNRRAVMSHRGSGPTIGEGHVQASTNLPGTRRRHAQRAVAALFTIGLLAMAIQIGSAAPAHAACYAVPGPTGIDYQCDIDGGDGSFGGGGGGGGRHGPLLDTGADTGGLGGGGGGVEIPVGMTVAERVSQVLRDNTPCRNLISGVAPAGGNNASQVWDTVEVTRSATPYSADPGANATAVVNGGLYGPQMTTYPPYYTQKGVDVFSYIPANTGLTRYPTDQEMQARTVLHELAHLTGALPGDGDLAKDFNLQILDKCFGIQGYPV
jgi:hypothetical protein